MATSETVSINRPDVKKLVTYIFDNLPEPDMMAIEKHLWVNIYDARLVDDLLDICAKKGFCKEEELLEFLEKSNKACMDKLAGIIKMPKSRIPADLDPLPDYKLGERKGGNGTSLKDRLGGQHWGYFPALARMSAIQVWLVLSLIVITSTALGFIFNHPVQGSNPDGFTALCVLKDDQLKLYKIDQKSNVSWLHLKTLFFSLQSMAISDPVAVKLKSSLEKQDLPTSNSLDDIIVHNMCVESWVEGSPIEQFAYPPDVSQLKKRLLANRDIQLFINGIYINPDEWTDCAHLVQELTKKGPASIKVSTGKSTRQVRVPANPTTIEVVMDACFENDQHWGLVPISRDRYQFPID